MHLYQPFNSSWQQGQKQTLPVPTLLAAGTRIGIRTGDDIVLGVVLTAINYGRDGVDNWYIEMHDKDGSYRYWKQQLDGGVLYEMIQ